MRYISRIVVAAVAIAAALSPSANAYDEPDAVKVRFPDPAISYRTPGFAPGRNDFTTQEELVSWLGDLSARATSVRVRTIGESQEGRSLPMLVL